MRKNNYEYDAYQNCYITYDIEDQRAGRIARVWCCSWAVVFVSAVATGCFFGGRAIKRAICDEKKYVVKAKLDNSIVVERHKQSKTIDFLTAYDDSVIYSNIKQGDKLLVRGLTKKQLGSTQNYILNKNGKHSYRIERINGKKTIKMVKRYERQHSGR